MVTSSDIIALRKYRGEYQSQFARVIGATQATVSRLEDGTLEPRGPMLILLERMLEEMRAAQMAQPGSEEKVV